MAKKTFIWLLLSPLHIKSHLLFLWVKYLNKDECIKCIFESKSDVFTLLLSSAGFCGSWGEASDASEISSSDSWVQIRGTQTINSETNVNHRWLFCCRNTSTKWRNMVWCESILLDFLAFLARAAASSFCTWGKNTHVSESNVFSLFYTIQKSTRGSPQTAVWRWTLASVTQIQLFTRNYIIRYIKAEHEFMWRGKCADDAANN